MPDRSVAAARELVAMFVEKRFQALSERAAPEIASDSQPQDWESIAALVAEHFGDLEESAVEPEPAKEPHALDIVTVRLQFERAIAQIEITLDPEGRYHKLRVINLKAQPS